MSIPRLFGPLPLTVQRIETQLQASSAGVYALGVPVRGTFYIKRIGRADEDLRAALKLHLGGPHRYFKFTYALSARDAYEKECRLFHGLITLENPIHPLPPEDTDLVCFGCSRALRAGSD